MTTWATGIALPSIAYQIRRSSCSKRHSGIRLFAFGVATARPSSSRGCRAATPDWGERAAGKRRPSPRTNPRASIRAAQYRGYPSTTADARKYRPTARYVRRGIRQSMYDRRRRHRFISSGLKGISEEPNTECHITPGKSFAAFLHTLRGRSRRGRSAR